MTQAKFACCHGSLGNQTHWFPDSAFGLLGVQSSNSASYINQDVNYCLELLEMPQELFNLH